MEFISTRQISMENAKPSTEPFAIMSEKIIIFPIMHTIIWKHVRRITIIYLYICSVYIYVIYALIQKSCHSLTLHSLHSHIKFRYAFWAWTDFWEVLIELQKKLIRCTWILSVILILGESYHCRYHIFHILYNLFCLIFLIRTNHKWNKWIKKFVCFIQQNIVCFL